MAGGGMPCQFCEGERSATVLVTWLTNGASIQVCPEDFSPAMINVLAVDLGVDPTKFYEGVRKLVDRLAVAQAKEDAAAAAAEGDAAAAAAEGQGAAEDQGHHRVDQEPGGILAGPDTPAQVP